MSTSARVFALVAVIGLVGACEGAGGGFPTGTYSPTAAGAVAAAVVFAEDGTYTHTDAGDVVDTGTYVLDGHTLAFETSTLCALVGHEQAIYWWRWDGTRLDLTPVSGDGCTDRAEVLTHGLYPRAATPSPTT